MIFKNNLRDLQKVFMLVNTQIGPYKIVEQVGAGGMAAVYRARQASVDRDVAIKVILKGIAGDPAAVQRFQREAKLIARLEHPHIVPVYDFDGTHEPPYIVMRYLDNGTLKDVMARELLPHNEIVHLIQQICSALDYAHRQGIIHRDIKPSNILIDRDGNAFVSDLGLGRLTGREERGKKITETGVIMGTPDYMSPDQANGIDDIDHRTDIYALGVILFEMLTGVLPFRASSQVMLLLEHIQAPVPSVLTYQPDLPEAINIVLQRALAKDRTQRYQTAIELSQAVSGALGVTSTGIVVRLRQAASTTVILRQATPSEQNKTVTVLYANTVEYEEIVAERHGDEAARRELTVFWTAVEGIVEEFGGQIFSRTDHDLLALWGADTAREDDAERAIRAALAMQTALRELGATFLEKEESLPLNIGIHRGLALLTPGEKSGTFSATGATIGLVSRLTQGAEGAVLITHEVFRQILGVFDILEDEPLKMRGRTDKVKTYRVLVAKARAFRMVLRGVEGVETPMVGREAEFKKLQKAFLMALEDRETQVATVVSDVGVGKSRLLYEFEKWAELRPEEYRIFSGRATPAMSLRPYAFVRDIIAFRFEVLEDDAPGVALNKIETGLEVLIGKNDEMAHFIAYLAGIDVSDSPSVKGILSDAQETIRRARQAFIEFITVMARAQPVVLELEDIHHADDASLDLLNDIFNADDNRHLLVIGCARPSLYERRPTWGSGQPFHTRIDLQPLDKRDSRDLALDILQKVADVPKNLRDLLVERAEGNPLYMEELVKMLLNDRVLIKDSDEHWHAETDRLEALSVPSTLSGLLETRLDTLLYPEKLTLQRASVVGRIFYNTALQEIDDSDDTHVHDVPDVLAKLVERGFIYKRETSSFSGSVEYIFASAMLRDTLYDRLLERQRRIYHIGSATWLGGLEHAEAYLPLIAEHFEKAGDTVQASAFLQRAGERAAHRGAYSDAAAFYQRALAHQPATANPVARLPLLLALGEAVNQQGDVAVARTVLTEALALSRVRANPETLTNTLYQLSLTETTYGDYPAALASLNEALSLARAGDNPQILANVLYGLANTHYRIGNQAEGIEAAKECIDLCDSTGNNVLRMYALNRLGTLIYILGSAKSDTSPIYYEQALTLARQIGHRQGELIILSNLGYHAADLEDWTLAIRYTEQALLLARELRYLTGITVAAINLADYWINANTAEKAAPLLREALLTARQMASPSWLVSTVGSAGWLKLTQKNIAGGLRLIGLLAAHPARSADAEVDINRHLTYARETLALSDTEIEVGMSTGKRLDLESVVNELLREFES